jgi:hypothetical protein
MVALVVAAVMHQVWLEELEILQVHLHPKEIMEALD